MRSDRIYIQTICRNSAPYLPAILQRVLPSGRMQGREYIALNPKRNDARPGSFKVNLQTGRWADFAVDTKGGDIVSLVAYVLTLSQHEAAEIIACMIGKGGYYD